MFDEEPAVSRGTVRPQLLLHIFPNVRHRCLTRASIAIPGTVVQVNRRHP